MPAVIPRFCFHLQARLKPIINYARQLTDEMSLPVLRDLTKELNEVRKTQTNEAEKRLLNECMRL